MKLSTISQVTRELGISTRTMRYYEQLGLLASTRMDDYAYRVYDEEAIRRLRRILLLRKLRIPLKQIAQILDNADITIAIDAFRENIAELDSRIDALSTIRGILQILVNKLNEELRLSSGKKAFDIDNATAALIEASIMDAPSNLLDVSKISSKEEETMPANEKLDLAEKTLSKLTDVRILHLPPIAVAASHFIGENPENNSGDIMCRFLNESSLYTLKPDARMFGFNHPNPSKTREHYGYETWVTIPDDMEVPDYLVKKRFEGGLYAAHMIKMGDFHEWKWLSDWVNESEKYERNTLSDGGEVMGGCLEEHLNFVYHCHLGWPEQDSEGQIDLLIPIKPKTK